MTFRSILLVSAIALLSSQASAQTASSGSGIYIGLVGGPAFFDGGDKAFDYNPAYTIGGQVGYKFGSWRAEGELSYQASEFRDFNNNAFDFEVIRGGASMFYDFATTPALAAITPYIGGGLGFSNIQTERGDFDDEQTGVTLHSEFGMTFNVTQSFALAPHYRYEWFETGIAGFNDYLNSHAFRVAARLGF